MQVMKTIACALLLFSSAALASKDAWVFVRDEDSVSMHGDTRDLESARSHLRESGPAFLWFRRDGKAYIVREGAALKEIDELADQQGELGAVQGRLGKAQGELGRQQGQLGRQQGEAGREQARKALREARRALDGKRAHRDDDDGEAEDAQEELGKAQEAL